MAWNFGCWSALSSGLIFSSKETPSFRNASTFCTPLRVVFFFSVAELLDLLLEDRNDLLLLLFRQPQLDRELVGDSRQRVDGDLRRRNDLVVGVAELVAARGVVGVAELVDA